MDGVFSLVFFLILGIIIFTLIKGISEWVKNNNSPRLSVDAKIVSKQTTTHSHRGSNGHHHTSHSYYITFQFQSGDRLELQVPRDQYGLLAEGDEGVLYFQGTRFLNFERKY